MRAAQHEKPCRVHPDRVEEIIEGHERPSPLGHREHLALVHQVDELEDRHLDLVGIAAERRHRRLQLARVRMVVRSHRYQLPVETTLALVLEVGDVRRQIRGLSIGPHHDPILVVAEARGPQPHGALRPVHVAGIHHRGQGTLEGARRTLMERALAVEAIEVDTVALER